MSDTFVAPTRGWRRARFVLFEPWCRRAGHQWAVLFPAKTFPFRSRRCDQCRRCGFLRWSW